MKYLLIIIASLMCFNCIVLAPEEFDENQQETQVQTNKVDDNLIQLDLENFVNIEGQWVGYSQPNMIVKDGCITIDDYQGCDFISTAGDNHRDNNGSLWTISMVEYEDEKIPHVNINVTYCIDPNYGELSCNTYIYNTFELL